MNPFANRQGIRNADQFYGREAELRDLFNRLGSTQSCSIVGPRRIGKSSLLYQLTHPEIYRAYLPEPENYLFAFIDLQELVGLGPDDFFFTAVDYLSVAAEELNIEPFMDLDRDRDGSMRGFRRFLMRLRRTDLRLVICLDEFEMLSENKNFGVEFFTYLRGLCSNYNLALITSSRSGLYELCHQGNIQTSQFWNIFVEINLGLMPDKEIHALITKPFLNQEIKLSNNDINFIKTLAGYHPFFCQICCYHLFDALSSSDYESSQVKQGFMNEATPHYSYAWTHLSREIQGIFSKIAQSGALGSLPPLPEKTYSILHRQAIIEGEKQSPRLSVGWQNFLHQINLQATEKLTSEENKKETSTVESMDLPHLRSLISDSFNESELKDLCFELGLDYETISGDEKLSKIRELIMQMNRVGRVEELVQTCADKRPHLSWPGIVRSEFAVNIEPPRIEDEFSDFNLKLEEIDNDNFRVSVLDSPAGQDTVVCELPFALNEVSNVMFELEGQMIRGESFTRQTFKRSPLELGKQLFQSIFKEAVGQLFFESWGEVRSQGKGLRIRIHIDPENSPRIAALPWEYLYNSRKRHFLSLNRKTPIVRYLEVQAPTSREIIKSEIRILVIISSPNNWPELDLSREEASIRLALEGSKNIVLDFLRPATPHKLHKRLIEWEPHIIHYMGHGTFNPDTGEGSLLLVDDGNNPHSVNGKQLGNLLLNTPSMRLAVLNACQSANLSRERGLDPFSGVATSLVMAGLPAVVAMQFPISDEAALAFANGFYSQLSQGESIERAVSIGRETLHLSIRSSQEWGTPVLFIRTSDGHLFEFNPESH